MEIKRQRTGRTPNQLRNLGSSCAHFFPCEEIGTFSTLKDVATEQTLTKGTTLDKMSEGDEPGNNVKLLLVDADNALSNGWTAPRTNDFLYLSVGKALNKGNITFYAGGGGVDPDAGTAIAIHGYYARTGRQIDPLIASTNTGDYANGHCRVVGETYLVAGARKGDNLQHYIIEGSGSAELIGEVDISSHFSMADFSPNNHTEFGHSNTSITTDCSSPATENKEEYAHGFANFIFPGELPDDVLPALDWMYEELINNPTGTKRLWEAWRDL